MPEIRLPSNDDRTAVIGRTGSGKTQLGVWLLSRMDLTGMPWVIIDYKGDELIAGIEKAVDINYDVIPEKPGVYVLHVLPDEEESLSEWFKRVWEHENIGIYIDEGYMIGQRDKWFNACLTQGRSKHIPMIVLTQRPLWLSRFVFSESSYFFVFDLTDGDDIKRVRSFVNPRGDNPIGNQLPKFYSHYYDVGQRTLQTLRPVPDAETILSDIDAKLPKKRRKTL